MQICVFPIFKEDHIANPANKVLPLSTLHQHHIIRARRMHTKNRSIRQEVHLIPVNLERERNCVLRKYILGFGNVRIKTRWLKRKREPRRPQFLRLVGRAEKRPNLQLKLQKEEAYCK